MKKLLFIMAMNIVFFAYASQAQAATYTVNTLTDDNGPCTFLSCSLREAIMAANNTTADDEIQVSIRGVHTLNITSGNTDQEYGDLDVNPNGTSGNLAIYGEKYKSIVSAKNVSDRAIEVHHGSLQVHSLDFTGGKNVSDGGGMSIHSDAVVTLNLVEVYGNTANTLGGGIYNQGRLNLQEYSVVEDNSAYNGGGIYTTAGSTTSIQTSEVIANEATRNGGGVFNGPSAVLSIFNQSTIGSNIAGQNGGGVYSFGDAYAENSFIDANTTTQYSGGGVFVEDGSFLAADILIRDNVSASSGGGVNVDGGYFRIDGGEVSGNSALHNGGGISTAVDINLLSLDLLDNDSGSSGGAINADESSVRVVNSTFANNTADSQGGAINMRSTNQNDLTLINVDFEHNGLTSSVGGAAINSIGVNESLYNVLFDSNYTAISSTICTTNDSIVSVTDGNNIDPENIILGSTTSSFDQVTFLNNLSYSGNAGIKAAGKQLVSIEDSLFEGNQSSINIAYGVSDGVLSSYYSNLSIRDTEFLNNASGSTRSDAISGVFIHGESGLTTAELDSVTFEGNSNGSVLQVGSEAEIRNSTFSNNIWNSSAGYVSTILVYANGDTDTVTLQNSTITGNTSSMAVRKAGDLALDIVNSTIANNNYNSWTSSRGTVANGIYAGSTNVGMVRLKNSIVYGNGSEDIDSSTVQSDGYNLIGVAGNAYTAHATDQMGVNPQLSGLANNGGSTQTHALQSTSPAVDAIPVASCTDYTGAALATDQRGSARPSGSACDIGAYEL